MPKRIRIAGGPLDRLLPRISPEPNTGCWLWTGAYDKDGYGQFRYAANSRAHRSAYTLLVGPIPEDKELDHTCGIRCCVNPDHLSVVTRAENAIGRRRHQLTCKNGHSYTEANTIYDARGWRQCRECKKQWGKVGTPANSDKTHCPQGHLYSETDRDKLGRRICKECKGWRYRRLASGI